MKVVSAAKLRKAQEAIYASRPYSEKLYEVLAHLSAHVDMSAHPLLEVCLPFSFPDQFQGRKLGTVGSFGINYNLGVRNSEKLEKSSEKSP